MYVRVHHRDIRYAHRSDALVIEACKAFNPATRVCIPFGSNELTERKTVDCARNQPSARVSLFGAERRSASILSLYRVDAPYQKPRTSRFCSTSLNRSWEPQLVTRSDDSIVFAAMAAIIISSRLVLAFLALLLAPAPAARAQDQTATAAGALPTGSGRWAPGVINGLWTAFKGTVANGSQPIAYLSATLTNKDIVTLVGATTEPAQHAPITGVGGCRRCTGLHGMMLIRRPNNEAALCAGYYFSQRYKQSKTKAATDSSHKVYNNWPSYKVREQASSRQFAHQRRVARARAHELTHHGRARRCSSAAPTAAGEQQCQDFEGAERSCCMCWRLGQASHAHAATCALAAAWACRCRTTIVAVDKNTLIAYDGGDPDPLPNPPTPLPDSWVLVRGDKTG